MRRWFILFLLIFSPLILLSQEKGDMSSKDKVAEENIKGQNSIAPIIPSQSYFNLEKELKFGKQVLENNGFLKVFKIYQAVRNENVSSCDLQECKTIAPALLAIRYTGEGRCNDIKDQSLKQLCAAVNSNNCNVLTGDKKKFCQSFLAGDVQALAEASGDLEIVRSLGFPVRSTEAALMLGIYNGFKQYNVMACERYTNQANLSLSKGFACKVMLSPNPDREINDLTNDLALFFASRQNSKPELCDSIVDGSVKDACNNSKIKELREVW